MARGPKGTPQEIEKAKKLSAQGLDVATIAERLGRDPTTVRGWIKGRAK